MPDPSMAATALEALFDLDSSAAAEIAEARLVESLSNDCVPAELVKLLHGKRLRAFEPIAERLEALGCDRKRLRPESGLYWGDTADKLEEAARDFAARLGGACGKAFLEVTGAESSESP